MTWLPIAADFRGDLRAAAESPLAVDRLEKLARLSQHQLGFLETMQLDQALRPVATGQRAEFSTVKLAVLGGATVDHLLPAIRVAGLRRRLLIDIHAGGYGQYRSAVLNADSTLRNYAPGMILFSLTAREILAAVPLTATSSEADAAVEGYVDDLRLLWRTVRKDLKATVLQQTFLDVSEPLFGSYDRVIPGAPARVIARLNDRLATAAAEDGVLLVDIACASARDGLDSWFDTVRWLQGKLEIAPAAAPLYGELVARVIAAQRGLSKKCLVLDLDNTLWGGVLGDDGIEGIVLGEGSALGEAHLAVQRYVKQLKDRGVILAVCSKNDLATAEAAFDRHPEMVLRRSDIAVFVANWEDKAKNLAAIARQLNIGLDSVVFLDDSPVERARIREALPMVAVPELPDDASHYVRSLAAAGYFEAVSFTADDRHRAAQYRANAERDAMLASSGSMDDFLRRLEMSVVFGPLTSLDIVRVTQLINKTNQFNPTTWRCTSEELEAIARAPENITLTFRLLDRLGDNGLVSAMLLRAQPGQPDILDIASWVMSCRVFGRQLEFEAMTIAVEVARRRGARAFIANCLPTPKNRVISSLYPDLGFTKVDDVAPLAEGATRWMLNLEQYVAVRTHIARKTT